VEVLEKIVRVMSRLCQVLRSSSLVAFYSDDFFKDDKMLMVWDLNPDTNNDQSADTDSSRRQPTAYAIPFPHPLTSINSHPSSSKEFLVSDCRGSIFLTDWRSDPGESPSGSSNIIELSEPRALSDASLGLALHLSGSVAWHRGSADMYVIQPYTRLF